MVVVTGAMGSGKEATEDIISTIGQSAAAVITGTGTVGVITASCFRRERGGWNAANPAKLSVCGGLTKCTKGGTKKHNSV